jgi:hypothetical protein
VSLRSGRVIILRSKGEYLGSVEAPDRERAEAVAIKQFDLDPDQRAASDPGAPMKTQTHLAPRRWRTPVGKIGFSRQLKTGLFVDIYF